MNQAFTALSQKADIWMREHHAEWIRDLQAVARIPSVSRPDLTEPNAPFGPECRLALDTALSIGRGYGFSTRDLDGYSGVLTLGDEEDALGIFAHLDVVPAGEGWLYPPFGATYLPEHEMLIGRGVDDNKGSFVMALCVMRMLREFAVPLRRGVSLYLGVSEENGMPDMAALLKKGFRFPSFSLVPDSRFPVNYGQKGSLKGYITAPAQGNLLFLEAGSALNMVPARAVCEVLAEERDALSALPSLPQAIRDRIRIQALDGAVRISASGASGHAAHPEGSVNALHVLAEALCGLGVLKGECEKAVRGIALLSSDTDGRAIGAAYRDDVSGPLTVVHSAAALKRGLLEVGFDCRSPITLSRERLLSSFSAAWDRLGFAPKDLKVSDPYYLPPDDPRVLVLQDVYTSLTGRDDPPFTMGGGTYSRVVPNAVTFGAQMPVESRVRSVLPEGHGAAHGPDEALPLEKVETCARIYLAAVAALDGQGF